MNEENNVVQSNGEDSTHHEVATTDYNTIEEFNAEYEKFSEQALEYMKDGIANHSAKFFIPEIDQKINDLIEKTSDPHSFDLKDLDEVSIALKNSMQQLNVAGNFFSGIETKYRIKIGKIYLNLQKKFRESKRNFKKYVEEDLGTSMRSVQRYTRLARYEDIEDFAFLGRQRLSDLISAMERSQYHGTITEFLNKYRINIDPLEDRALSNEKFKIQVSKGILCYLSEIGQWEVTPENLERFAEEKKGSINYPDLIKEIEVIVASNGAPDTYFKKILKGGIAAKQMKAQIKALLDLMEQTKESAEIIRGNKQACGLLSTSNINTLIAELENLKKAVVDSMTA
jgi:hypothetical protein